MKQYELSFSVFWCLLIFSKLNKLNAALEKDEKRKVFQELVSECTLAENIWISRIILKEMHLGFRFEYVLKW